MEGELLIMERVVGCRLFDVGYRERAMLHHSRCITYIQ